MSSILVAGRWSGSPVIDFRYRIGIDFIPCGLYAAETMAQIVKEVVKDVFGGERCFWLIA